VTSPTSDCSAISNPSIEIDCPNGHGGGKSGKPDAQHKPAGSPSNSSLTPAYAELGHPSGCAQCGPVEITAPTGRVPVIGPELETGIPPGASALAPETGFVAPTLSNRCHVDVESASGRYTPCVRKSGLSSAPSEQSGGAACEFPHSIANR
jgi:hypothetical protein